MPGTRFETLTDIKFHYVLLSLSERVPSFSAATEPVEEFDHECSHADGYIRQPVYACLTCHDAASPFRSDFKTNVAQLHFE